MTIRFFSSIFPIRKGLKRRGKGLIGYLLFVEEQAGKKKLTGKEVDHRIGLKMLTETGLTVIINNRPFRVKIIPGGLALRRSAGFPKMGYHLEPKANTSPGPQCLYYLTEHADDAATEDGFDIYDVENGILTGRVRRTWPRDKKYKIVGSALGGRRIGAVCRITRTN